MAIVWGTTPFFSNLENPGELLRPLAEEAGLEVRYETHGRGLTEEEMIRGLPGVVATIAGHDPYTPRVFERAADLRIIARAGVGMDRIDSAAATASGVVVTSAVGQNADSVAEHTMAILLSAARRIPWLDKNLRAREWEKIQVPLAPLTGKTLGLLGFGNIGRRVARRAAPFGMKILAYDPAEDREAAAEIGASFHSMEEVVRRADFLCCHMPLLPETEGLIGPGLLRRMKPGAFIVNTSRGGIVNLDALAEALRKNVIRGAAIDVFPEEPPDFAHPVFELENIVVTPHAAARGEDSVENTVRHAVGCILEFLAGRRPPDVWNPEVYDRRG